MNSKLLAQPRSLFSLLSVITISSATAQTTVTSITYNDIVAASPQTRSVSDSSTTYSITYNGIERRISSFLADGLSYTPSGIGTAHARRNNASVTFPQDNPSQTAAWNAVISTSGNSHTVSGQYYNTMDDLFTSRNVLSGTENLFVNQAGAGDVVNNVERMDFIFGSSFQASDQTGFALFERGNGGSGANGGFKIAAITGINGSGIPSTFGNVIHVGEDSYDNSGNGAGLSPTNYDVFRFTTNAGPDLDTIHNSDIGPQHIAGSFIKTSDLVTTGTTIYGYAVFGEDGPSNAADVVDWTNTANWVTGSSFSNDVDLVATGAVLYTSIMSVPEPSSALILSLGGVLLLGRRKRSA